MKSKQIQGHRTPTMKEFEDGTVIMTCQDCIHSNLVTIDKRTVRMCTIGNFVTGHNDVCDDIQPLNIN